MHGGGMQVTGEGNLQVKVVGKILRRDAGVRETRAPNATEVPVDSRSK